MHFDKAKMTVCMTEDFTLMWFSLSFLQQREAPLWFIYLFSRTATHPDRAVTDSSYGSGLATSLSSPFWGHINASLTTPASDSVPRGPQAAAVREAETSLHPQPGTSAPSFLHFLLLIIHGSLEDLV